MLLETKELRDTKINDLFFSSVVVNGYTITWNWLKNLFGANDITLGDIDDLYDKLLFSKSKDEFNGEVSGEKIIIAILNLIKSYSTGNSTQYNLIKKTLKLDNSCGTCQSYDVKDSEYVFDSTNIVNSHHIMRSGKIESSKNVSNSIIVTNSCNIFDSSDITDSQFIYNSKKIKTSQMIVGSDNVKDSVGIIDSKVITDSALVVDSVNTFQCLGVIGCTKVSRCIMCSDLENDSDKIGNQPVSPDTFDYFFPIVKDIINDYVEQKLGNAIKTQNNVRLRAMSYYSSQDEYLLARLKSVLKPVWTDEIEKGILSFFRAGGVNNAE